MKILLPLLLVASFPIWVTAQINPPQLPQQPQQPQQPQLALKSPCKAGAFGSLINPSSPDDGWRCYPAPPGYFAPAGSTAPILCPVGTISYGNAESCKRIN
jgi:hypothetical protein